MHALEGFKAFVEPLEKSSIDYFITGSVAAMVFGEPRMTHDIDLVIHLERSQIQILIQSFSEYLRGYLLCTTRKVMKLIFLQSLTGSLIF